jgi:phosphocarrier protein
MEKEAQEILEIINKNGLHARPASLFVSVASKYESEIYVEKDGESINAKSIMGLLMLSATCGSTIKIIAKGADAEEAIKELKELVVNGFNED